MEAKKYTLNNPENNNDEYTLTFDTDHLTILYYSKFEEEKISFNVTIKYEHIYGFHNCGQHLFLIKYLENNQNNIMCIFTDYINVCSLFETMHIKDKCISGEMKIATLRGLFSIEQKTTVDKQNYCETEIFYRNILHITSFADHFNSHKNIFQYFIIMDNNYNLHYFENTSPDTSLIRLHADIMDMIGYSKLTLLQNIFQKYIFNIFYYYTANNRSKMNHIYK